MRIPPTTRLYPQDSHCFDSRDYGGRIVEIQGFDAQACGGTHVSTTSEIGRFSIFRTENKGRQNKRLYVRLDPAEPRDASPA